MTVEVTKVSRSWFSSSVTISNNSWEVPITEIASASTCSCSTSATSSTSCSTSWLFMTLREETISGSQRYPRKRDVSCQMDGDAITCFVCLKLTKTGTEVSSSGPLTTCLGRCHGNARCCVPIAVTSSVPHSRPVGCDLNCFWRLLLIGIRTTWWVGWSGVEWEGFQAVQQNSKESWKNPTGNETFLMATDGAKVNAPFNGSFWNSLHIVRPVARQQLVWHN